MGLTPARAVPMSRSMVSGKQGPEMTLDVANELKALRDALLASIERIATVPANTTDAAEIQRRMKLLKELDADIRKFESAQNARRS